MRSRLTLLCLVPLALAACSIQLTRGDDETASEVVRRPATVTIERAEGNAPHSPAAAVIEDVLPSVVNVRVRALGSGPTEQRAQGSGVIIDESGVIVTNNHVVASATGVTVVFTDGRESLEGTVLGTDPEKDLAVVKVEATDLSAITLGHSGDLKLGDEVIALGFPLGLGGPTVTMGIVSGTDRNITVGGESGSERLEGVLQTDAAINPGNSGGALVDRSGQLVGINTAAASAGFAENIGFAISIDSALPVIEQILEEPPEKRAWLGVSIADLNPTTAVQPPFEGVDPDTEGAGLVQVFQGGPADEAGLRAGEVITRVEDTVVDSAQGLTEALREHDPGETVTLTLVSAGGTRTVEVELGVRPLTLED